MSRSPSWYLQTSCFAWSIEKWDTTDSHFSSQLRRERDCGIFSRNRLVSVSDFAAVSSDRMSAARFLTSSSRVFCFGKVLWALLRQSKLPISGGVSNAGSISGSGSFLFGLVKTNPSSSLLSLPLFYILAETEAETLSVHCFLQINRLINISCATCLMRLGSVG